MSDRLPDFKARAAQAHEAMTDAETERVLEGGRSWDLAPTLRSGGSLIFPHTTMASSGHHAAAAVHACLDSGATRVLVLGTLHALDEDLEASRVRVANGGDPSAEASWGVQGPGASGRSDWLREFSLDHFLFLWEAETKRRGTEGPELVLRYPYLAGGHPEDMPGIEELEELVRSSAVIATIDPFHHGVGYGDAPDEALPPEAGGLVVARESIDEGLSLLREGDYAGYNRHCVLAKSDGRDVGQVLRHLLGPLEWRIIDIVADDMSEVYRAPAPTWVAGALVELTPAGPDAGPID